MVKRGSFFDGFQDGVFGAIMGGYSAGAIGGVTGGIRANKIGMNFWDGDEIIDTDSFNSIFVNSSGDLACSDCNFNQGERLSTFRADLSSKNDYGQLIKAYKKANFYNGYYKKEITMGELFDFSTSKNWHLRGWKLNNGSFYTKNFRFNNEIMKAFLGGEYTSNFVTNGVGTKFYNRGFDIRLFDSGYYNSTYLGRLRFSSNTRWSNNIIKYINDFTKF